MENDQDNTLQYLEEEFERTIKLEFQEIRKKREDPNWGKAQLGIGPKEIEQSVEDVLTAYDRRYSEGGSAGKTNTFLNRQEDVKTPWARWDSNLSGPDELPPGYTFNPNDDVVITDYLNPRIENKQLSYDKIKDVDLYQFDPYQLSELHQPVGDKVWYFYTQWTRKYPNGSRLNRAVKGGFWKATGVVTEVGYKDKLVGSKRTLVYHKGTPQNGTKTNWIMIEYVSNESPRAKTNASDMTLDDWVLCKIYQNEVKHKENAKQPVVLDEATSTTLENNEFSGLRCVSDSM